MKTRLLAIALSFASAAAAQEVSEPTGPDPEVHIRSEAARATADFRKESIHKLLSDPRAPLDSAGVFGLRYFPHNDTFRVEAVFRPSADTTTLRFPTSDGQVRDYRTFGSLLFRLADSLYSLDVYEVPGLARHPLYRDYLFLPFFDATNGETTYGGGRYLDLSRSKFAAGDFALDFHRAYNPWCAYAEGFSCPVPPLSNALPLAVRAGEAAFAPAADPAETP